MASMLRMLLPRLIWPLLVVISAAGAFLMGGIGGKLRIEPFIHYIDQAENAARAAVYRLRGQAPNTRFVESALLELELTSLEVMPGGEGDNVGFSPLANGYLVGKRAGELFEVAIDWSRNTAAVEPIALRVPTEKDRFLAQPIAHKHPTTMIPVHYGVKDILAREVGDRYEIFASYHHWKADEDCVVMRFSRASVPRSELRTADSARWDTLYETTPCLALDAKTNRIGEDDSLLQAGGRMVLLDDTRLLITVGDHFMDGFHNENGVQDKASSYGKTHIIDLASGGAELFTLGHRNPQGVAVDAHGQVWATEHGPRGGDELNLLVPGRNYGWPHVSYGTLYAGYDYPEGYDWTNHVGFEEPIFAWSPSIAVNNLIRLEDSKFGRWGDDFLILSLANRALHRVRVVGQRVSATERIEIGDRLRDLGQTPDGDVLIMSDSGVFFRIRPANDALEELDPDSAEALAYRGRQLWLTCSACHRQESGVHHIGPALDGIVGRPIGRYTDFSYSEALGGLSGTWTEEELDRFLKNPVEYAPGTSMVYQGLANARDRQALIGFLGTL